MPSIAGNYSSLVVSQYFKKTKKKQQISCKNIELLNTELIKREKTIRNNNKIFFIKKKVNEIPKTDFILIHYIFHCNRHLLCHLSMN